MVLVGRTVVLPCVNRRSIWVDSKNEEEQQVVHWDHQAPGVHHDQADRLIDLYASGKQRHYGRLFIQQKMNISASAFSYGNFSLIISDLQPADQGLYSCHLHHHYCGLHERRIFQLTVSPPVLQEPTDAPHGLPIENPSKNGLTENYCLQFYSMCVCVFVCLFVCLCTQMSKNLYHTYFPGKEINR